MEQHDDGRYADEFEGWARLDLTSHPRGARATLFRYVEKDMVLVPSEPQDLCATPVVNLRLRPGSYLVTLDHPGCRTCRYPVFLERNGRWRGEITLYAGDEIGDGFVHVPAGPFISGGDPEAGSSEPRRVRRLHDFFILARQVTAAEYLAFLRDLDRRDRADADRRAPRDTRDHALWTRDGNGVFQLPASEGGESPFAPDNPIHGIHHRDALAYAAWRSQRDGRRYFLPTSDELEKAARGTDGRAFPWGDRWADGFCSMMTSKPVPALSPAASHPRDCSPYGSHDHAGNMRDLTRDILGKLADVAITRGGGFRSNMAACRAAARSYVETKHPLAETSFRLVHYGTSRGASMPGPANRARNAEFTQKGLTE